LIATHFLNASLNATNFDSIEKEKMSNNKTENVNQVNNYFINYYLNQLRKRLETVKNPNFKIIYFY
jgi:hypothetical protein